MPGETKIFKSTSGWYNVERPIDFHKTREHARNARRGWSLIANTAGATIVDTHSLDPTSPLSTLQSRLYDRLTQRQGVPHDEAVHVIKNNGYNKAASYGHMREAGANHAEALVVIGLDSPDISLAYGKARAIGEDHTDALMAALRDTSDWTPVT